MNTLFEFVTKLALTSLFVCVTVFVIYLIYYFCMEAIVKEKSDAKIREIAVLHNLDNQTRAEATYTEAELVGFGNYLLSKERRDLYKKEKTGIPLAERLSSVNDSDLSNFFNC